MENKCLFLVFVVFIHITASQDSDYHCPKECVCYRKLTTVKCEESSMLDLPRMPKDQAEQVEVLDMSRSKIEELKTVALAQFPNLKRLILRGNNINRIEKSAFQKVSKLQDLDLRENALRKLPKGVFPDMLKVLYLASNPFSCEPQEVQALVSVVKDLKSRLEEFDDGLLKCDEPQYMSNVKLTSIIDADADKSMKNLPGKANIGPAALFGIFSGIAGLVMSTVGAVYIVIKRKKEDRTKYHYNFLTSAEEDEEENDQSTKMEESLAARLIKQRRQSQGYPSQDIIDSEDEEAVDQESYIKEKLKTQRRHSMGYALENESDEMEDIDLQSSINNH